MLNVSRLHDASRGPSAIAELIVFYIASIVCAVYVFVVQLSDGISAALSTRVEV